MGNSEVLPYGLNTKVIREITSLVLEHLKNVQ